MHPKLMQAVARLLEQAPQHNLTLVDEREIPYGVKLDFTHEGGKAAINVYYSAKKGVSMVPSGKKGSAALFAAQQLAGQSPEAISEDDKLHEWSRWVGVDESGKGDWFGPLVASGFVADSTVMPLIRELKIQDSKKMRDDQVRLAAKTLLERCPRRIETIALPPEKYNSLYADFKSQGRNLNDLLAWMHAKCIANLNERFQLDGAVIDRFTHVGRIKRNLGAARGINIVDVTRGERDPAVAAASVMARYRYLVEMDRLSEKFDMKLPKGAGKPVDEAGVRFAQRFSFDRIGEAAKLHFANTNKLVERLRRTR